MISFPVIIIGLIASVAIFFFVNLPVMIFLHELGHAIPALIFTKGKVAIYLGEEGEAETFFTISIGRLDICVKKALLWKGGMCVAETDEMTFSQMIIYGLGGSIFPLIFSILATYVVFECDMHGLLKLFDVAFLFLSLIGLINLLPGGPSFAFYSKDKGNSDGALIQCYIKAKRFGKSYEEASKEYSAGNYKASAALAEKMLKANVPFEGLDSLAFYSYFNLKDYQKAIEIHKEFGSENSLPIETQYNVGYCYLKLNLLNESIVEFEKVLEINPDYVFGLNALGYVLAISGKYEEAVSYLDKALLIDDNISSVYDNRALAKIKLGDFEGGLNDVNRALQLDINNAYAYRSLGIYHLDQNDNSAALDNFKKAKELDADTYCIDELIEKASS